MSDIEKILVTSTFTIIGGVAVYVVGQLLSKFIIEPVQDLRKVIGEVRFNLAFHAPEIHTPIGRTKEKSDKVRDALMKSSCDLLAKLQAISLYNWWASMSREVLPSRRSIEAAAVQLRGLSTYVHRTEEKANDDLEVIAKRVARIETLLGLKPFE
ncbi:MAG: hypothetical protein NTY41_11140 [Proteobacteria bacterium]|nr:hypothetical protein [Pseudomonadota bacterium]